MTSITTPLPTWPLDTPRDAEALLGQNVLSSDGEKVGTFTAAYHPEMSFTALPGEPYFRLRSALVEEAYLPGSAIAGWTPDGVWLALPQEALLYRPWDPPPDLDTYRQV
jgi:hypothetical protein